MSELLPLVLVVDDEARSLDAIRRNLDEDFTILTATGADEARALLELHEVSVILCDQRMPGTSGVSFLKEVRERWPEVPIHLSVQANTVNFAAVKFWKSLGLERVIPDEFMMHAHHWIILHGRYTCLARKPRCEVCIINDLCRWPEKTV